MAYYDAFAKHCLRLEEGEEICLLIEQLPIGKLTKLHLLLLSETFIEQSSYKVQIPDGVSVSERFHILTSGGYEEKARFIDKYFQ